MIRTLLALGLTLFFAVGANASPIGGLVDITVGGTTSTNVTVVNGNLVTVGLDDGRTADIGFSNSPDAFTLDLTSSFGLTPEAFELTVSGIDWGVPDAGRITSVTVDGSRNIARVIAENNPAGCGGDPICEADILADQAARIAATNQSIAILTNLIVFGDDFISLEVPENLNPFVRAIDFQIEGTHVVPLPAAAWFFITALGGLVGARKLKSN